MEANVVYWNVPPPTFPEGETATMHDLDSIVVAEEFPCKNFRSHELPDQQRAFYTTVKKRVNGGNLSDQEIVSQLMLFFYEYDDNNDGFITKEEFFNALQKSGASQQTAHDITEDTFESLDTNNDGRLSTFELVSYIDGDVKEEDDFATNDDDGSECALEPECETDKTSGDGDQALLEEPRVPFKKLLDLKQSSASAIEIFNQTMLSCVWLGLSKNTYGFFIRNMLLCGSHFENQMVPQTIKLLWLSFLGVVVSVGMQFCLAWFLWIRLPQSYPLVDGRNASLKPYPLAGLDDENGGYNGGRGYYSSPAGCSSPSCMSSSVPLPANEFPNYKFANDICRTDCIIQIICIGLFLFNVLNNVPGLMKNILIIMQSEKFISEDEEGITKLHYWRQSDFSSEDKSHFLHDYCQGKKEPSAMRVFMSSVDSSSHPFVQKNKEGNEKALPISSLESVRIVGLYFSAHWCYPCRIFTPKLIEFYKKINSGPEGKVFEVVFVSSDSDQDHFDHYLSEMPWMAIPFPNKKAKSVLSNKYDIRGIPTLILLDGFTGSLISVDGRAFVENDPEAAMFPWSQKSPVERALELFRNHQGPESHRMDPNNVVGLFFPQGQGLHGFRQVSVMLKTLVKRGVPFEMIVIPNNSSDEQLLQTNGCYVIPCKCRDLISELYKTFQQTLKQGTSCLVLVEGATGHLISENGRQVAFCDPDGTHYPWKSLNKFSVLLDHCCLSACGRDLDAIPAWTLGSFDVVGLFFVSDECAPCLDFAPALARAYIKLKALGKSFRILMIAKPSDTCEYKIRDYMPADVLFLVDSETRRKQLYTNFQVTTTPTLLLCSGETGEVITRHGRINVLLDEECESFPWPGDSPLVSKFCDYLKGSDKGDMEHRFNLQLHPRDYGKMGLVSVFSYPLYYLPSKCVGFLAKLCFHESQPKVTEFQLTRGCLEVIETRNFIAEVLAELNEDSGQTIGPDAATGSGVSEAEMPSESEVQAEEQFRRLVKVKLVRADFLVPFDVRKLGLIQKIQIFLLGIPTLGLLWWALFNRLQAIEAHDSQKSKGKSKTIPKQAVNSVPDKVCCDSTCETKPSNASKINRVNLDTVLKSLEKKMEADKRIDEVKDFRPLARWGKYPSKMRTLRFIAFCFGVLPEILTLLMISTVGVQYILWSGYKIGSDTQGMEEIILATLAIVFVYDIDESIYDYTLPEMLKNAHEKDRFNVNSWAASAMLRPLRRQTSFHHFKLIFQYQFEYIRWVFGYSSDTPKFGSSLEIKKPIALSKHFLSDCLNDCDRLKLSCCNHYAGNDINQLADKMSLDFDSSMPICSRRALKMCSKSLGLQRFNDFYLAKQYPFLYARKFQSFYRTHVTESFIHFYSSSGSHFFVLLAVSLAIVGAYRTIGQCGRFSQDGLLKGSVWSTQIWPNTCMMKVQNSSSKSFSDLSGISANEFMAVSCGLSGYVPDKLEWEQSINDNYFSDNA